MISSLRDGLRGHPRAADATLAVVVLACSVPGSMLTPDVPWWPAVLLAGASCAALPLRRRRPRATVVTATVCATVTAALGYVITVLLLGPLMVALYGLAMRSERRTANTFTFSAIAVLVATTLAAGPSGEPLVLKLIGPVAWLLLPTALGTADRLRTAYLEAERARAEHRVTEERLRIARDLHDVVAHHLVLAGMQAGLVARLLRTRPEEAEQIVTELTGTTASAVRELKATVGLLRRADEPEPDPDTTPGIALLPELASSFRHAGLAVTLTTEGQPRPLPARADLAGFRIVQEALTNVTKHAATRRAEVRLTYSGDWLGIAVSNDGTPLHRAGPGGYGLLGMRERAQLAGGRLRAGPRPRGGFEVVAQLPLDESPASHEENSTS